MNWKFAGDRPVYQQIMAAIRGSILKEELSPGSKVPSVRDLAAEAQVNPNTMQRALAELEREGLVHSLRTAGRFVTEDEAVIHQAKRTLAQKHICRFLSAMADLGYGQQEIISLLGEEQED